MLTTLRLGIGLAMIALGFWMAAVMSPPDPPGWSIVAIVLLFVGAVLAGNGALDLMDDG